MKKSIIFLVRLYQKYLSPDHSVWARAMRRPPYCRHIPSCSEYMIEAVEKRWVVVGLMKGTWRILRCNPWGKWGYDPVDKKEK
ncbi:MAG: hypothetical protein ACD_78C00327G0003 [uncultured bacterium (gcode 4)]|uniref:Putative membrane protein insertion efficiency factor n=1 Tax=uncultured bacterium (gcode 4) TaxID=1234023 RepID=K1YWM4_9BACT|nr:MAG: hypothetical protein ACD_78C00327G0003 [uncultured bacterium (gcode 4)]